MTGRRPGGEKASDHVSPEKKGGEDKRDGKELTSNLKGFFSNTNACSILFTQLEMCFFIFLEHQDKFELVTYNITKAFPRRLSRL